MIEQQIRYCIIVAGGSGIRMGSELPKQFIELNGKPVLMHTIEKFYLFDSDIRLVVTLPQDQQNLWKQLCSKHNFSIQHKIVNGGITRFHSVKNALNEVGDAGIVAVHDGVRPLVSNDTIKCCFDTAIVCGTAIPVVPLNDSVREVVGDKSKTIDRCNLRLVQTPQVFYADILHRAYRLAYRPEFTDDASVVEHSGIPVTLVDGNVENIKLTYPSDITVAEILLLSACSS